MDRQIDRQRFQKFKYFKDYQITEEFIRKIIQRRFKKSEWIDRQIELREIFFDRDVKTFRCQDSKNSSKN